MNRLMSLIALLALVALVVACGREEPTPTAPPPEVQVEEPAPTEAPTETLAPTEAPTEATTPMEEPMVEPAGIMEQEQAFLSLMQSAATFQISAGQLGIFDSGGNRVLVFIAG